MMLIKLVKSFACAFRGISLPIRSERNMRIHTLAVIVVCLISVFLHISLADFMIFLLLFGMVLGAEMMNSAIEGICNILRDRYHLPYDASRDIRDIAAGAVLIQAIIAAIIGVVIITQYIVQ